jgi:hypothetical protein
MARPEVTGRKLTRLNAADDADATGRKPDAADDADAYSVSEFCARHRFSPQLYYKLKPMGLMPVTFNVGSRVLISREAAAAWRRERETAAQADD